MENENKDNAPQRDLDWEQRRLCSDPACIGVIGSDGRCKECGKSYEGDPSVDAPVDTALPEAGEEEVDPPGAGPEATLDAQPADTAGDDEEAEWSDPDESDESLTDDGWKNRRLCSDPACIGVIGPDGRCKECGKPSEGD